ncbi:MAG: serine/threonine-protein kinase, partial [Bacteroidota bacterium]
MSDDLPPASTDPTPKPGSADRWQRVEAVFEQALERPPAERAAFLDRACADDADLRAEVESLLAAYGDASGYFGRLADEVVHPAFQEAGGLPAGTFIGPYEVVRLVGRGGMGEVYEARRGDGTFDQTVALKLVPRSGSAAVLRRFEAERQILAGLDHPHIARLLDGGLSGEGRPYFAMEFVRGLPITTYCDRHRLGIDARLRLFRTVCDAVQHAHRRLVVHRDLKPSNILVAETEAGEPVVKLLDFGIAKVLDVGPDVSVLETQTGLRLMTPEYAAPEQVRGETITTATDVYALGVLLYELLTGHRPYRLAERLPHEVERVILEEDPIRPSTAVTEVDTRPMAPGTETPQALTIGPATVSEARATEASRLRRRLAGDLDRICLMALRKEPDRRYGSATDLAEDVRRHLDGLPVAAQPDTLGYRARKFVRRNRAGVGAAAAVALALVVGLGAALWQARVAATERDRAQTEAATATEVTNFLVGLFEASDPAETRGDSVLVREVLERGAERIETDLEERPEIRARLQYTLGLVYERLGVLPRADSLLSQARVAYDTLGMSLVERAGAIDALSTLRRTQGRYDEAEVLDREALALARAADSDSSIAAVLNNLGYTLIVKGAYDEAEPVLRESLALKRALHDTTAREDVAVTLDHLGILFYYRRDYEQATTYFGQALDMLRVIHDAQPHPDLAVALDNTASLHLALQQYDEAEPLIREALAMHRALHPEPHPSLAIGLNNLGVLLLRTDRLFEAKAAHEESLSIKQVVYGPDHPSTGNTLGWLGAVAREQGDLGEAETYLRESLAIAEEAFPVGHSNIGGKLRDLAGLLGRQDRFAEAEALYVRGYEDALDA